MSSALVVNADDLGVSKGATLGIIRAHREGIVTSASLAAQAQNYRDVFTTCLRTTACQLVTMWGFTDKDSWVPGTFPGFGDALPWHFRVDRFSQFTFTLSQSQN